MTFDEYKKLDEFERERFLRQNGVQVSIKIDNCRHSYALIDTLDKSYVARDRSGLLEYLELIYLWYYTDKQKLFDQEAQEFLQTFHGQFIDKQNLYHIKFGLQNILRKYQSTNYVKVIAQRNTVNISECVIDFDIQIL